MRKTYRARDVKDYWEARWLAIPADAPMQNETKYPLKYSIEMIRDDKSGSILEAGCGAGRILRYYHNNNYRISGFDYIDSAISKLKQIDSSLKVSVQDVCRLSYESNSFNYILAFGLYHNLEKNLDDAMRETYRCLKDNGMICASFRADNIQNRINDYMADQKYSPSESKHFHKLNLTKKEYVSLFQKYNFTVHKCYAVENMPLLYKFKFFRHKSHKSFDESRGRVEGYRLSIIGALMQRILMKLFPYQFCNIYVIIAQKNS